MRLAFACCACAALAPCVHAASSYPVAVSATILTKNVCKFNTTTGTITIPPIDPSGGTSVTGSVSLSVTCTGSTSPAVYTITSDDGQHRLGPGQPQMSDGAVTPSLLAYTLNVPLSGSMPKSTPTNVIIQATVTKAQFENAPAKSYTDLVTLTISP